MKTNEVPEKIYLDSYGSGFSHGFHTNKLNDNDIEYIRKDVLVKYLSEEKGYPITLNGELVHWDELNKHLAEYIKLKNDAFIEKTENFIRRKICDYIVHYNYGPNNDMETMYVDSRFIEDFKNYMKGE